MQITKITDKQDLLLNPKKKYLSAEVLQSEYVGVVRHRESAWLDTCDGEIRQLRRQDWTLTVF